MHAGWSIALIGFIIMLISAAWSVRASERVNATLAARRDAAENGEDSLVNLSTGEVLEPGTRRWRRQAARMKVVFREEV